MSGPSEAVGLIFVGGVMTLALQCVSRLWSRDDAIKAEDGHFEFKVVEELQGRQAHIRPLRRFDNEHSASLVG